MRVLIIALLVGSTQAFPYTKDRYLIHCQVKNEGDQRFLQEQVSNNAVDVWGSVEGFGNSTKRILASQEQVEQLQSRLQCDRAMDIRKLEEEVKRKDLLLKSTTPGFFSEYQSYAKIQQQLHSYKGSGNLAIKVERIGQSYEGREISVIRLTLVKATASPTRKIWLSCGQHAREWIAPAACLYLVDKLIESFGSDTRVTRMLKTYEVLVAPLINPDGYEYSRTSYRYWRKNRHPFPSGGIGVDLNRNWNTTHFGEIGTN